MGKSELLVVSDYLMGPIMLSSLLVSNSFFFSWEIEGKSVRVYVFHSCCLGERDSAWNVS